jgi:ATP-binding cassette subfamily F protein uup
MEARKKLGFKEKYELEQLEKEMPILEEKKSELTNKLGQSSLSYDEIEMISKELHEVMEKLDGCMLRWMELDDLR